MLSARRPEGESRAAWTAVNAQIAGLSRRGEQRVIAGAGHMSFAWEQRYADGAADAVRDRSLCWLRPAPKEVIVQPQPPRQRLTRRLLKLLAAAGASASGAYLLYESAPWLDYEQVTAPIRRPFEPVSTEVSQKRELVRYATPARYRTRRAGRSSRSS